MDLIDISRPLSPATAVWPGDQPVEWDWTARLEEGSSVNLGAFRFSTHAGTHVDTPYHVRDEGASSSDAFDLSVFVGAVEVIDVQEASQIRPSHVAEVEAPRVLFKTSVSTLPVDAWPDTIAAIAPEAIATLDRKEAVLVGTDAPSVDPLDSTDLPAHHALIEHGIINLEGLHLAGVEPGRYSLIALPLRLEGADAVPVRAVLGDASLL
jgi:arylformamidase